MSALWQLVKMGTDTLVGMATNRQLRPEHLWVARRGAAKYRKAIANGDVAEPDQAAERASQCALCTSMRLVNPTMILDDPSMYCGAPFEERLGDNPPTCGCLVGVSVQGKPLPGGKALVASEQCPQGRWGIRG